jgi:putative endonuclease
MAGSYFVYILTTKNNTVLYTGVTNDLIRRVWEHREKVVPGFTAKYNVDKLVYYEIFIDPVAAIEREKQIKSGRRSRKIDLITEMNPSWRDLYSSLLNG